MHNVTLTRFSAITMDKTSRNAAAATTAASPDVEQKNDPDNTVTTATANVTEE